MTCGHTMLSGIGITAMLRIELYTGDLDDLLDLLQMSMGIESAEGARHLLAIEQARGTRYYVAKVAEQVVGLIGVWFDPTYMFSVCPPIVKGQKSSMKQAK